MAEAAAKEPSMEDILASIRKIIAQDDPRPKPTETPPVRLETLNGAPQAAPQVTRDRPQAMPAMQSSAPASSPSPPSPAMGQPSYRTQTAPRPNSASTLAALASQVRQEMPRGPAAAPQSPSPAAMQTPVPAPAQAAMTPPPALHQVAPAPVARTPETFAPQASAPAENGAMSLAALAASVSSANQTPRAAAPASNGQPNGGHHAGTGQTGTVAAQVASVGPRPGPAPAASAPVATPAAPAQAVARAPEAAQPEKEMAQASEVNAFRDALVSPSASRMVAGSLDRLKAAVADDTSAKVEAVLRPMLREWLDANLPGMVERIVREEIERIARG
jgi:uncharacterized protein